MEMTENRTARKYASLPDESVAVIGAGISGLTAAFRLLQIGIPVTVYEAGPRAGGVIHSTRHDGFLAEAGPNMIMETNPEISSLIRDLDLEDQRIYASPAANRRFVVRDKKMRRVPATLPQFLTTRLFSWRAKFNLLREPFIPRVAPDKEESVSELVIRRLGREFLDYAINPLVAGVYAGDPARLSVKHAFPKLHAVEREYGSLIRGQIFGARKRKKSGVVSKQNAPKFSFGGGLQVLIDALVEKLGSSLRLRHPVEAVTQFESNWTVRVLTSAGPREFSHSAVLWASPAHKLAALPLETIRHFDLSPLADIPYSPIASVVLGFPKSLVPCSLNGFGMLVPEVERLQILGCIFSSSVFPGRAPDRCVTLTTYVGGNRAPGLPFVAPELLIQIVRKDLRRVLGIKDRPIFQNITVFPKAIPQYEVGFGRFKSLMSEAEQKVPGFFIAGNFRDGTSLGDAILSGHGASKKIEHFLLSQNQSKANLVTVAA